MVLNVMCYFFSETRCTNYSHIMRLMIVAAYDVLLQVPMKADDAHHVDSRFCDNGFPQSSTDDDLSVVDITQL